MIPLSQPHEGAITFAQPDETVPYSERLKNLAQLAPLTSPTGYIASSIAKDLIQHPGEFSNLFGAAERATMLVETMTSESVSREQAYDRRIKAVKDATGIALDNPERYRMTERERRQLNLDGIDPTEAANQPHRVFEQKLSELRAAHPDKAEALAFGDISAEAKAIAKGAEDEYEAARKDTKLGLPANLAAQFGGAAWGMRRDPLFVGSLVAGPTTAVGKTVAARIATSGLFQGLYNMGITALEQPVVQAWRNELGLRSGVQPAMENIGLAFLFGAIPGAAFRGVHEIPAALRPSVRRVLDGVPQDGDLEKTMQAARSALGEIDAEIPGLNRVQTSAIRLGEEMDAAEKITRPPPARDVSPELHDDLTTAAQRYADDPVNAPSPAGVAAVEQMTPQGLRLEPTSQSTALTKKVHDFDIFENEGKIGTVKISELRDDPTALYIDWVGAEGGAQSLGLAKTRSILHLIKEQFPDATTISGQRVTGAVGEGRVRFTEVALPEIEARIAEAQPRNLAEAQKAASEAIEDIGNRESIARTRAELAETKLPSVETVIEERTTARGDKGIFVRSADEPGDLLSLFVEPDSVHASVSIVGKKSRGQGVGMALYERALAFAREQGLPLRSDMSVSTDAIHVYEALRRRGYDVSIAPGTAKSDKGMTNATAGYVYEVKPKLPTGSKDPIDQLPWTDAKGNPDTISPRQAARVGDRETQFAELIRECK